MTNRENIAFIASTLPINFICQNFDKLRIKTIYVPSIKLLKSTQYINKISNHEIDIKLLPKRKLFQFFYLLNLFLKFKYKKCNVIFFHEIKWIVFDIAFFFIKPKYKFYPQVKLNAFITKEELLIKNSSYKYLVKIFLSNIFYLFSKLMLLPKLKLLFIQNDNCETGNISYRGSFSCQDYKKSEISSNSILKEKNLETFERKIIFLCGCDICSSKEQLKITEKIIEKFLSYGFKVDLKGHPNWDNIYPNLQNRKIIFLDKYIPFELIDVQQYQAIIGFGSTVLARYPQKSISLLYLIKSVSIELIEKKASHLKSFNSEFDCLYPKNESDLEKIINLLLNQKIKI